MNFVEPNQAYTSKPLVNHSIGYFQSQDEFICTKVLPIFTVPAGDRTGDIYSYGKDALRIVDTQRAIGGSYNEVNLQVEKTTVYRLDDYGLSIDVLDEDIRFAEAPIDAEMDATDVVMQKLMLDMEKKLADSLTSSSVLTNNIQLSGTNQRDQYSTSDPFANIRTGIKKVKEETTKIPNTLILGWDVLLTLMDHPLVLQRFSAQSDITPERVAAKIGGILGFAKVFIGKAQYNNSNDGASTQNFAYIWSKVAIVAYIEDSPKLKTKTLGRTFTDKSTRDVQVYPKTTLGKDSIKRRVYSMVLVNMYYDQVILDTDCAYLIYDAIA